jgi:putative ABC transport system ATP-binding protein
MTEPLLRLHQLCKTYQDADTKIKAIHEIDLQVQAGEFLTLYGPSGSGKTTLLNLIGGLESPDQGQIWFKGQDLAQLSVSQLTDLRLHQIGFIFQSYNLIPVLNALENVAFIMQMQGHNQKHSDQQAFAMLKAVGLEDMAHRRPAQLSGGQQQRVAVARAIAAQPGLVLADEPTANLDSDNSRALIKLLKQLNQQQGITFIITSHDPEVIQCAPRRIQLKDGEIVKDERDV